MSKLPRDNVDGQDIKPDSISTEQATIGKGNDLAGIPERPEVTESATTVQVDGTDSIQDAVNNVPRRLRHNYTIEIDETAGDFAEDIIIPQVVSESMEDSQANDNAQLRLTRKGASGRWTTTSIYAAGGIGIQPAVKIDFAEVKSENPYSDEKSAIGIYGGHADLFGCKIGTGTAIKRGVDSYGSSVFCDGNSTYPMDFSAGGVEIAYSTKSQGEIHLSSQDDAHVGSVQNLIEAKSAFAICGFIGPGGGYSISTSGDAILTTRGFVWDGETNSVMGGPTLRGPNGGRMVQYDSSGDIQFFDAGNDAKRAVLRANGDLDIEGTLNEGAGL